MLDLEALAAHRGSVLGELPDAPQPTQKSFETAIWSALSAFDPARPVYVESESRKVGNLRVPEQLIERMRAARCFRLEAGAGTARGAAARGLRALRRRARRRWPGSSTCLRALHGAERIDALEGAARPRATGSRSCADLLESHYDPAYRRSLVRNYREAAHATPVAVRGHRPRRLPGRGARPGARARIGRGAPNRLNCVESKIPRRKSTSRNVSERPHKIGKYSILSELGQGASADVYLGEDPFNDRKVAVKVAKSDADMGEEEAKRFEKLFLNEASLAGKLNHPNIVGVFDAVVDGDLRYIVMEYVPGGSLKKFCTETNLLPVRQAVLVIFKMCRALDYAFQNGVIHRDIKPANILLSRPRRHQDQRLRHGEDLARDPHADRRLPRLARRTCRPSRSTRKARACSRTSTRWAS